VPTDNNCPIPLKYIDILRSTSTDIRDKVESEVKDIWYDTDDKKLSVPWIGKTTFILLRPKLADGWYWIGGRATQKQKTTRPDSLIPEVWGPMKKSDKAREVELWKTEGPLRQSARDKRAAKANRTSFVDVPLTDEKNYEEIMSKARLDLAPIEVPAMPLVKESIIELKSDKKEFPECK
jgi:hypothetical protein